MSELNIKDVMVSVVELLLSREGDVDTDDGSFATCGTDEIIRLDCVVASFLNLPSDDVSYDDLELIIYKIENLDKPQSEWISVDDRLPSEDVPVICYSNDIVTGWQVVLFINDNFWRESSTGAPYPAIVTHWMPLPAPPKQ